MSLNIIPGLRMPEIPKLPAMPDPPPPMTPRCDGCRYWIRSENAELVIQVGGGAVGWCVRFPAVEGKAADEWCGEYDDRRGPTEAEQDAGAR